MAQVASKPDRDTLGKKIGIMDWGGDGSIVIVKLAWTRETNWERSAPSSRWR